MLLRFLDGAAGPITAQEPAMMMTPVHALREAHPNVPLVERLMAAGLISQNQLQQALQEKSRSDRPLGQILVELGMISRKVLGETLGQLLGDDRIDLSTLLPDPRAVMMLPRVIAEQYCVFPMALDAQAGLLTLAVSVAFDVDAADEVSRLLDPGVDIATVLASDSDIKDAIQRYCDAALAIPDILREIDAVETKSLTDSGDSDICSDLYCRLIDAIIVEAAERNASAIHFEPEFGFLRVRFRIDGVLCQATALHSGHCPGLMTRLVEMSGMCLDDGGARHKGRLSLMLGTQRMELGFSRQETLQGFGFLVTVRAREPQVVPLEELGLSGVALRNLQLMMARSGGLIAVTGPPASGKTTTLYSLATYRCDESVAIVALDDTTVGRMPLIRQISTGAGEPADEAARFDSLERENYDVLVIGELRDRETTTMAMRAALSGRQVLAALTAKSALSALSRLKDLGLNQERLANEIIGVVGQRVLRKLCPHCKQAYSPPAEEWMIIGADGPQKRRLFRAGSCAHCHYLGYKGRIAIFEILKVDEPLRELLARKATSTDLRRAAVAAGLDDIAEEAIRHVLSGETSLSEASRVVDLSGRL